MDVRDVVCARGEDEDEDEDEVVVVDEDMVVVVERRRRRRGLARAPLEVLAAGDEGGVTLLGG